MAEYKGKLLKGIFTKASKCLLNSGASVESMLSDSGWVTINAYLKYRKIGDEVHIKLIGGYSISTASWTTIGNLPQECRPSEQLFICPYYSNNAFLVLRLYTNGDVAVNGSDALGTQYSYVLG